MILKPIDELWQPCDGDTRDGICLPFNNPETIKIYAIGIVTAINVIDCSTGTSYPMLLSDWDYVIANSTDNQPYTYLVNPTLPGGLGGCFYFEVTYGGADYYTPCYQDIADTNCLLRDTTWIESEFAGYDCLGRWYGAPTPQSLIDGDYTLSFNNGMLIWGTKLNLPTEYEFTNFDTCIVTQTKALAGYEVEAFSIAPYFMELVEAIIGRGVIWLDAGHTKQYAVQSGTHFEKIRAFCRSQYDMKLILTDCACNIYHECDLGYDYVPVLDCQSSINYHCETAEEDCFNMESATAVVTRQVGGMEFVFSLGVIGAAKAVELENMLNGCVLSNYALRIVTDVDTYYFYQPYISNVVRVGNTVTFDYSDFLTPPVTFDCEFNWINDANWASLEVQSIEADVDICCYSAALIFELVVTGSPLANAIWSANVPFTQIDLTHISVELPQGGDIEITVDVFPELCGEVTISVTVNDTPTYEGRFIGANFNPTWNPGTREFYTDGVSPVLVNTTVASTTWNVLNLGDGYTGPSPTTVVGSSITLTTVGLNDDFVIQQIVTDIHGNVSTSYLWFGQNSPAAPDSDFYVFVVCGGAVFTGTSIDVTSAYVSATYNFPFPLNGNELGLDADMDGTYEQTASVAGMPIVFTHDYLAVGNYQGRLGVSFLASVPPPPGAGTFPAVPFGLVRVEYALQII
jgi:hypothetical protein